MQNGFYTGVRIKVLIAEGKLIDEKHPLIYAIENSISIPIKGTDKNPFEWYSSKFEDQKYKDNLPTLEEVIRAGLNNSSLEEATLRFFIDFVLAKDLPKNQLSNELREQILLKLIDKQFNTDYNEAIIHYMYYLGDNPSNKIVAQKLFTSYLQHPKDVDVGGILAYCMINQIGLGGKDNPLIYAVQNSLNIDGLFLNLDLHVSVKSASGEDLNLLIANYNNLFNLTLYDLIEIYNDPNSSLKDKTNIKNGYNKIREAISKKDIQFEPNDIEQISNMNTQTLIHKINKMAKGAKDETLDAQVIVDALILHCPIEIAAKMCKVGEAMKLQKESSGVYNFLIIFAEFVKDLFPRNKSVDEFLIKMIIELQDRNVSLTKPSNFINRVTEGPQAPLGHNTR